MIGPMLWMVVVTYPILPTPGKSNRFVYFGFRGTLSTLFPPTLCEGYAEMFWTLADLTASNRRCTAITPGGVMTAPGWAAGLFAFQVGFLTRLAPRLYGLLYAPPVQFGLAVRSSLSPRVWWGVEALWRRGEIRTVPGSGRSETLLELEEIWISGVLGTSWVLIAFRIPYHHIAWWGRNPKGMFSLWLDVAVYFSGPSSPSS